MASVQAEKERVREQERALAHHKHRQLLQADEQTEARRKAEMDRVRALEEEVAALRAEHVRQCDRGHAWHDSAASAGLWAGPWRAEHR